MLKLKLSTEIQFQLKLKKLFPDFDPEKMRTILITGSDTGIGKTRVVGLLAGCLAVSGHAVQIIKPVESGYTKIDDSDAEQARAISRSDSVSAHTLFAFKEAIAPLVASKLEGIDLSVDMLVTKVRQSKETRWRLIEGAGGMAVPLSDEGTDWVDFARELPVDAVVVVIEDRLGAINQARLTIEYAKAAKVPTAVWLNEIVPQEDCIKNSNTEGILSSGFVIAGRSAPNGVSPEFIDWEWFETL